MNGSISKRDGKWTARWRTPDGRQPRRSFQTKRAAERFLRAELEAIETRRHVGAPRDMTVSDLLPDWAAATEPSVKPRSWERYDLSRRIIDERLGATRLVELDYRRVQLFVSELAAEYAPRTVRAHYGVLQLVLKDAVSRGLVRPLPKVKLPRVERPALVVPRLAEVELLAAESRADVFAMVLVAGYCGLREGELLGLQRRDVHLEHDGGPRLWIHQARNKTSGAMESTKTEERRWIALPLRVAAVLAEHLDEYPGEMVFAVSASTVQKSWELARRRAGLELVRFHDLRHAAASMMIAAGATPLQVAKQLGHADATTTMRLYAHLWDSDIDQTARRMDAYIEEQRAA